MDCGNSFDCYVYCQDNCFKNGVINAMSSWWVQIIGDSENCFENAVFNIGKRVSAIFEARADHTFYNIQIHGSIYSDIVIYCGYVQFFPFYSLGDTYDYKKLCQKMTGLFFLFSCNFESQPINHSVICSLYKTIDIHSICEREFLFQFYHAPIHEIRRGSCYK